jgi:hypothetical protein
MENASKALIIAGAILLSILIIGIGMYIYNSSSNSISNAASQISQQDISSYNKQFEMYEGKQVGTNVKSLIQTLISGAQENQEEVTKLPDLIYEPVSGEAYRVTSKVGGTNIIGFNKARTAIESKHYYNVVLYTSSTTALIDRIVIEYDKGSLVDKGYDDASFVADVTTVESGVEELNIK